MSSITKKEKQAFAESESPGNEFLPRQPVENNYSINNTKLNPIAGKSEHPLRQSPIVHHEIG